MYLPAHFAEPRIEALHRIVRTYPLGMLVTHSAKGIDADHLPFEFDADRGAHGTLVAHVARANPLWSEIGDGAEVMVVFRGAEGYVSPSWYPSKHENHRSVPTWNYEVVHAHGRLRIVDEEKFLRGVVGRLTRRHESTEPRPWKMGEAPRDYMEMMMKAIVGIEVELNRLEGKRKLSQNRDERDAQGVVSALLERGREALSTAVSGVRTPDAS
jgi:transcriptional regulator